VRATDAWIGLALLVACSSASTANNNQPDVTCSAISGCPQYKSCCTLANGQESCQNEDSSGNVVAQLPPECAPPADDGGPNPGPDGSADGSADGPNQIYGTVLAPSANAIAIAADGSGVYWIDPVANAVMHVPVGGGTVTTFASGQGVVNGGLAVDGGVVYWAAGGNLWSAPDFGSGDGGSPLMLAAGLQSAPASGVFGALLTLVIHNGVAYWNDNETVNNYYQGTIKEVPLTGPAPEGGLPTPATLVSPGQQISGLVTDGSALYWIEAGTQLNNFFDGSIDTGTFGGAASTLAGGSEVFTPPAALAVVGSNVYWSTEAIAMQPIGIMSVTNVGGTPNTVETLTSTAWPMVADGASLYWSQQGTIVKMQVPGGPAGSLTKVQPAPDCMAVDATNVYVGSYVSGGGGNVVQIAK
jgi:hypothetical protein